MKRHSMIALVLVGAVFLLGSCSTSSRTVSRVSTDTTIDLSGRWNDADSRDTAFAMVDDVLRRPWIPDFVAEFDRKPVVIVGEIRNRSSEHIDVSTFVKDIERELINSGKIKFVASAAERSGVRDEKADQQVEANAETIKRLGRETGADYMLIGVITSQTDAIEGRKVVVYKVDLELINIETNEKAWIGSKAIKKDIAQSKFRM